MASSWHSLGQQGSRAEHESESRDDGGAEQRWRRTVDLRKRPATMKVGRLLQEFGYAELSPSVVEAIEERLARVSLTVEPSLRVAEPGDIVAITRSIRRRARPAAAPPTRATDMDGATIRPEPPTPATTNGSPVDVRAAERIMILERELRETRLEVERLRAEIKDRSRATGVSEDAAPANAGEPPAKSREARRELAELVESLHHTQIALTGTRTEIRQCSELLESL